MLRVELFGKASGILEFITEQLDEVQFSLGAV